MIGTAGDYVKFLETIRLGGKEILRPESVKLMTENQVGDLAVPAAGDGWGWGLGFAVLKNPQSTGSPLSPGSWKWGGAYGHSFWVDPVRHMTVVAFTNTALEGMSGKFPDDLKQAVYAGLSDDLPKSERK
jgi:CubicO group peptidase (beta-lactamase class C family)